MDFDDSAVVADCFGVDAAVMDAAAAAAGARACDAAVPLADIAGSDANWATVCCAVAHFAGFAVAAANSDAVLVGCRPDDAAAGVD